MIGEPQSGPGDQGDESRFTGFTSEAALPSLTPDLAGVGGVLKQRVEDFVVEEIPAYQPEGSGEFLFLWVEKAGLSAEQLTSHLARFLKIAHQDIGMAGMKDRQAITRQMISVPAKCESRLGEIRHENIRVLEVRRHRHKLRTGHLRGNKFSIFIQQVAPDALEKAAAIRARLVTLGFPNYFGEQRFGREAETLQLGFDLLRHVKSPGDIPRARRKFLLRLAISAAQSVLFNQALASRLTSGTLHRALPGDLMQVCESGGLFLVEDVGREQPRLDAHEIVPTGPLFGPKMKKAGSDVGASEAQLLASCGLTMESFAEFGKLALGTRRPYLVWPQDFEIRGEPAGIRLEFSLPSGCYATVLLREFQKN